MEKNNAWLNWEGQRTWLIFMLVTYPLIALVQLATFSIKIGWKLWAINSIHFNQWKFINMNSLLNMISTKHSLKMLPNNASCCFDHPIQSFPIHYHHYKALFLFGLSSKVTKHSTPLFKRGERISNHLYLPQIDCGSLC